MSGAYEALPDRRRRLTNGYYAALMLTWDEMAAMPEGGAPARSKQLSTLPAAEHDLLTAGEFGDLLAAAERETLDPGEQAVVREIRRYHDRQVAVSADLYDV